MKTIDYIDKTFPITLQDLNDLAKVHKEDPKDLNIEIHNTKYVQCAVLNQDGDIQLYPKNGYPQPKTKENEDLPRFDEAYHILSQINDLINILSQIKDLINMDLYIVSEMDLKDLDEAYTILNRFYEKQLINQP